jgi:hypothetical protein
MSGTLQVGGVTLATHTESPSKLTLDSGLVFPAGHVLQVVHTETSETNTLDTTYTNYYEVPLTLKSSSSNVIVSFTFQYQIASDSSGFGVKIYRKTSSGVTTSDTEVWTKNPTNTTVGPFTVYTSYSSLYGVSTVTGKDSIIGLAAGDTIYYALFARAWNSSSTIYLPADSATDPENGFFSSLIMEVQK